jgi:hypothetical protein
LPVSSAEGKLFLGIERGQQQKALGLRVAGIRQRLKSLSKLQHYYLGLLPPRRTAVVNVWNDTAAQHAAAVLIPGSRAVVEYRSPHFLSHDCLPSQAGVVMVLEVRFLLSHDWEMLSLLVKNRPS